MADEEITVTLEPEAPIAAGETVKVEQARDDSGKFTKAADPAEDLRKQFEEQAASLETERQARQSAEQRERDATARANQATQEVQAARGHVAAADQDRIASGVAAAQAEIAAAEQEFNSAYDAGDKAAMAAANRKMMRGEAKILRLDEAKADLEQQRPAVETRRETTTPDTRQQSRADVDPVEQMISQRSTKTASWLRSHPDHAKAMAMVMGGRASAEQERLAAKLTAADSDAIAEGYARDSKEYFDHVETFIGLKKTEQTNGHAQNGHANAATNGAANGKRRPSVPAAPVTQSGGGASGNSGTEVRLSRNEAAAATDGTHQWNYDDPSGQKRFKKGDPIGVQEFARRKHEMTKQGLYDKSYVEQ